MISLRRDSADVSFADSLDHFYSAWWTGAFAAVVTIRAGAAASFFSDNIQSTLLVPWWQGRDLAFKPTIFGF